MCDCFNSPQYLSGIVREINRVFWCQMTVIKTANKHIEFVLAVMVFTWRKWATVYDKTASI